MTGAVNIVARRPLAHGDQEIVMSFARVITRSLATVALAAGVAGLPQLATAGNEELPGGSWTQTCRGGQVRNDILYAECRRSDGRYIATSEDIESCAAFGNREGELFCETPGDDVKNASLWAGSYRKSCTDVSVDKHGKLKARCRKNDGNYQSTNLTLWQCINRRAANRDGKLVCETDDSATSGATQWKGSFRQSCRDISSDSSGTLTATCQTAKGKWQRSSLSVRQCSGYVAGNRDGELFCESSGTEAVGQWTGTFRQSCRDRSIDSAGTLTATCKGTDGNWHRSSLSVRQCASYDAGNVDGKLFCESSDRSGVGAEKWHGTFRKHCRQISSDSAGTLMATCWVADGIYHRSSLSPRRCESYLAGSRDGTLVCEAADSGAIGANQWQGSFRQSCRDVSSDSSGTLSATCQAVNGSWHRSSLQVRQCGSRHAGNRDGNLFCEG